MYKFANRDILSTFRGFVKNTTTNTINTNIYRFISSKTAASKTPNENRK